MQVDNSEGNSELDSTSSDPAREEQRQRALSWTHEQMENTRRSDSGRNSASSGRTRIRGRIDDNNYYDDDEPMDLSSRESWSRESQDYSLGTSSGSARLGTRPTSMTSTRNSKSYEPAEAQSSQPLQAGQAVARRSGWHNLMVEAGGISAAVSDESMRKLKYCLEWLQVSKPFPVPLIAANSQVLTKHPFYHIILLLYYRTSGQRQIWIHKLPC